MKKGLIVLLAVGCSLYLTCCAPALQIGAGLAGEMVGSLLETESKNGGGSSNAKVRFAPEIDTEQTVRQVLDKGGEPQNVIVLTINIPVCKILFYKRGDLIYPILFTHNEEKGVFVYQNMWTWKKKEFNKKKDTPEYRKACEEWYSNALAMRANQYGKKDKFDLQYRYIQQIEAVSPIGAGAYNAMAWFYATCPNPKYRDAEKAVAFAEKSVSIKRLCQNVDTLAAAHAEAGDFNKAVQLEEEAIRMCPNQNKKADLMEHLNVYRSRKTYAQWKYGQ